MNNFKRDIFRTNNLETTNPCDSYTASTSSSNSESYTYIDCNGIKQTETIGAVGGYDANTFCAREILTNTSGVSITYNGACVV